MPLPSRSQIDRLGERLAAALVPADQIQYFALRAEHADALADVEQGMSALFAGRTLASRLKTLDSVVAKIRRNKTRLSSMQDIAGCRLIVRDLEEQEVAVRTITSTFDTLRTYDLRDRPHSGYRAVHIIALRPGGLAVEVQVRTELQELWAALSEKLTHRHGLALKYGGGPQRVRARLDELSAMAWELERGELRHREEDGWMGWDPPLHGLSTEAVRLLFMEKLARWVADVASAPLLG